MTEVTDPGDGWERPERTDRYIKHYRCQHCGGRGTIVDRRIRVLHEDHCPWSRLWR